jgi:hypothetical protein
MFASEVMQTNLTACTVRFGGLYSNTPRGVIFKIRQQTRLTMNL